jgi:LCP family protein required for cell wall assembly
VWGVAEVWALAASWNAVGRVDATPTANRAPDGEGRNVLLVGSDSRAGLSAAERKRLGTGDIEGNRTDSIMLLHTGSGDPTLMSIPRDSYVDIPGHGMNKINASFSIGGPKLLATTIEQSTGLRVDGYMEIGFGGFASVVDSVDGVRMCLKAPIQDDKAHIDLPKGCQVLDGKTALGYVRARYFDPEGDLGRVQRQRQFLGALMDKVVSPADVLLPWRLYSIGTSIGSALTIGEDDSLIETARTGLALRSVAGGNGNSVTIPVANANLSTSAGSAVQWDEQKADQLFTALKNDQPLSIDPSDS